MGAALHAEPERARRRLRAGDALATAAARRRDHAPRRRPPAAARRGGDGTAATPRLAPTRRCATRRPATRSATRATTAGAAVGDRALRRARRRRRSVNHQDAELATTISFNLAEGATLDDAQPRRSRRPRPTSACRPTCAAASRARRCAAQQSQGQQAMLIVAAHRRHLHRARHALREPGASDHGAVDAAVGRRRRGARAAAVPDGVLDHRADRRVPADRHRQEERDPDHRLRARGRARARPHRRSRRCARPACCASGRS